MPGRDHAICDVVAFLEAVAPVDRELARARTAARSADARTDPAQVADRLIAVLRRTPDGAKLDWCQDIVPGFSVLLDGADLAEALGALAENAARHARSRVTVSAQGQGNLLRLNVTDDGPGIPAEECEALVGRHARADESGTGLGLSIASEIALAAGGTLELTNTDSGFMATLVLPCVKAWGDGDNHP